MNAWLILLYLLSGNRNGGRGDGSCRGARDDGYDCNCERTRGIGNDCGCEQTRDDDCGCEPRFEPRFDARPFNNSDCGCTAQ